MSAWPWDLKLEVDFDTDPGAEPGVWTDLSGKVHGSGVNVDQSSTTLVLNDQDRSLDPTNTGATYNLVPWRHARLTATYDAVTYPLFRGFVEDWPPVWPGFNQGLVRVRLVDAFAWFALSDADLDLPAQTSHERITALLDLAGWPAGLRDIGVGVVPLEAVEQDSANLYRTMLDTVDAEDGLLYTAPDGKVTYRSRHHDFDATPILALGTDGWPVSGVTPRFGGRDLVNIARSEQADGDVYEVIDDASVTSYGPHSMSMRDLPFPPAEAEGLAQWTVLRFAQPRLELDGVQANGHHDGGVPLPDLLSARLGDVATFQHTPPGGGTVDMTGTVEDISHRIGKGEWVTSVALRHWHGDGPWFTLDDDVLGLPDDTNKLSP